MFFRIRLVLEILDDQRVLREGEVKRFRAEGDFLVRALVDLVVQRRSQIGRLESEFAELEKLAGNMSCREMFFKQCITWPAGEEP